MCSKKFISPNTFKVVRKTGVKFDDVIGMENLKNYMCQVMTIMKNPREYAKKGVRMPKGVILEGAPGNGKTLFARAVAGEANVNFIAAKATDFESMFMAIGPMKVKLLFKKARRRAPCIVFIDEFDGIGTKRNYSGSAIETENTRIVTALLNELDGFETNSGILVLAATNSLAALDEALVRPGRFDAHVSVPYPNLESRIKLCEMYLRGKNYDVSVTAEKLARHFDGASCAKIESALNEAVLAAELHGRTQFSLDDVK
ncbi:ATP-binding protein [Treponema zioleckii]|uniref:ATP-binding protein n=1 Tax=Treponema zioleckii TaxID=331680 RepID=UPI00168AAE86|nr:AAA family ATPase [Treponema zioleckii]